MKSYMLLALTFTVAQAVTYGLTGTPLSYARRSNLGPRYGIAGRPEYTETLQRETGNFYGGQRDGQFIVRDGRDNVRGLQYSSRPGSELSSYRGYYGSPYNQQQYGTQDAVRRDGYGYGAGRGQISFNAPLANTRSYNPQFDSYRTY